MKIEVTATKSEIVNYLVSAKSNLFDETVILNSENDAEKTAQFTEKVQVFAVFSGGCCAFALCCAVTASDCFSAVFVCVVFLAAETAAGSGLAFETVSETVSETSSEMFSETDSDTDSELISDISSDIFSDIFS